MPNLRESDALDQVRGWLVSRCGISFADDKLDLLRQRMEPVMRRFDLPNLSQLADRLGALDADDLKLAVLHAASINHTYFFREPQVLDTFIDVAFEQLQRLPEIRIWSAAASTGDEAYTIAIMLAERFGNEILDRTQILGTDISGPVVEKAEAGIFHARALAQMPPELINKYFKPIGDNQYQINQRIRSVCTFRRMNLKATPYPFTRHFQAVFCRNILYYFDADDQRATVRAIHDAMEIGGILVTSVAEPLRAMNTPFHQLSNSVYQKVLA